MIKATYYNDTHTYPPYLVAIPNRGEYIRSKDGFERMVKTITHVWDYEKELPYIVVEFESH